jgi:SAM-dependent methyltransferase
MNDKQIQELDFWVRLIKSEGVSGFIRRRRADFYRHMDKFNGWADLSKKGLEIGSGLYSMMNFCNSYDVRTIDPLSIKYRDILFENKITDEVRTTPADGESILENDNTFDWIVNWNVIDHTPKPDKMIGEMYRVLKPGGKLYFEVNFDDKLAICHYSLWNKEVVDEHFSKLAFKKLYSYEYRNEPDKQSLYYGVYQK